MTDDRRAGLEELFQRVCDLPEDERRQFLDRECGDAALRAEVEALLRHDEDPESFAGVFSEAAIDARISLGADEDVHEFGHGRYLPGALIGGRYRIAGFLGRGGIGEVYRADDLELGQAVALKFLSPGLCSDVVALGRLRSEVRLARQISHPNVCRVHDIGELDGQHYLTMEYVDGEDLGSLLRRIERFSSDRAVAVARQLCLALDAAHRRGVIHRDLKPTNVMVDGRGRVVITDFGIAALQGQVSVHDVRTGTPAYMAPEQLAGIEVSYRTDIYSLGLVLYEIFTGKPAFESPPIPGLGRPGGGITPPTPSSVVEDIPTEVERIVLRCLDPDPAARPASALEVAAALPGFEPLAAALATGETPTPEMLAAASRSFEVRVGVLCGVLAFVILGLVVVALTFERTTFIGTIAPGEQPPVLAKKARDLVATLGFHASIAFEASGFFIDEEAFRHIERERQLGERPDYSGVLRFWYRASPTPLVPRFAIPDFGESRFKVSRLDPAPIDPGMVSLRLRSNGQLVAFSAVAPPRAVRPEQPVATEPSAPLWVSLFAAAGLDGREFLVVASAITPPVPCDQRFAWSRAGGEEQESLRIEAASLEGLPVLFALQDGNRDPVRPVERVLSVYFIFVLTLVCLAIVAAGLLARHNLRSGRGDRRGAFRLALVVFVINMLRWVFQCDHVTIVDELGLWFNGFARSLNQAFFVWLFYLALEPWVRRRWPNALVSWSRVLSGRLRDPMVGRDLLAGVAVGVGWGVLSRLEYVVPDLLGLRAPPLYRGFDGGFLLPLLGFTGSLAEFFHILKEAISVTFMLLLLLLVLRVVLRGRALVCAVYVALTALLFRFVAPQLDAGWPFDLARAILGFVLLVRLGVVAHMAAVIVFLFILSYPMTSNLSAWYAGSGLFAMAVVVVLAGFGAHSALAGRSLLRTDFFER